MDTNIVVLCGKDCIPVNNILYTEITTATPEELLFFEELSNGAYTSPDAVYSPSFRDEFNRVANKYDLAKHSKPSLKPEDAPERYRWDNPSHWEMMTGDKFHLLDFDDTGDANVRWTFRFRSPERFGNFTATSSRIIKLKYLIARLEGILNRPVPKNKLKKGWIEFWTSTKYSDIQKDISPLLEQYNVATATLLERNKKRTDFVALHQNTSVLRILLKDGSKNVYLQNHCDFDIFEKETEIYSKIKEYEIRQEKINNSSNRGEKDVEYTIKWFSASNASKHIVSIDGNCESKHRYNCILLRNDDFIDEAQEYDHILVTPAGIILIETKDWKGSIDITSDGKWIRHQEENAPLGVASPIQQMHRHELLMKSILPDIPVYNILCFSNSTAIVRGKEYIKNYVVVNIEQLDSELSRICSYEKITDAEIDEIVSTIESHKINKIH